MPKSYHVKLDIFRGAGTHPIARRTMRIIAESALDACCRAEELVNVTVADNEYAASYAVIPIMDPQPAAGMVLAEAA